MGLGASLGSWALCWCPGGSVGVLGASLSQVARTRCAPGRAGHPPGTTPRDTVLRGRRFSHAKLATSNCHQLPGSGAGAGGEQPRNRCHLEPRSCETGPGRGRESAPLCCQQENIIYDGWCCDEAALLASRPQPGTQVCCYRPAFSILFLFAPSQPSPLPPSAPAALVMPTGASHGAERARSAELHPACTGAGGSAPRPAPTDRYLTPSPVLPVAERRFISTASARPLASKNDVSRLLVPIASCARGLRRPAGPRARSGGCERWWGAPSPGSLQPGKPPARGARGAAMLAAGAEANIWPGERWRRTLARVVSQSFGRQESPG